MWLCTKCSSINFNRGACECCSYTGKNDSDIEDQSWLEWNLTGLYDDVFDENGKLINTNDTDFEKNKE